MTVSIRLIGDVHGKFQNYADVIRDCDFSIQVGDMGVFNLVENNVVEKIANHGHHRFIRGNHDNPYACQANHHYIPDGHVEMIGSKKFMFIGGASSIDRSWRTQGIDWWPEEELSITELNDLIDKYVTEKPHFMVTHECPESVACDMFGSFMTEWDVDGNATRVRKLSYDWPERTRKALQAMFEQHVPEIWVFGHWHYTYSHEKNGCQFLCLGELDHKDFEV